MSTLAILFTCLVQALHQDTRCFLLPRREFVHLTREHVDLHGIFLYRAVWPKMVNLLMEATVTLVALVCCLVPLPLLVNMYHLVYIQNVSLVT